MKVLRPGGKIMGSTPMGSAMTGSKRRGNLMLLASLLAPYIKQRREMQSGGMIPYQDYGQDDSGSMSYQSSMDDFSADNSAAMNLPPQDFAQERQPVFEQPIRYTKKEKRKKRRDLRKQNRIAAREERKSLKAMGFTGAQRRAAKKQIRQTKRAGRKDLRDWKRGKIDEIGMDQQMY